MSKKKLYVCNGAKLRCDCGSSIGILMVTQNMKIRVQGKLKATDQDVQIEPPFFGSCSVKNGYPCTPALMPWTTSTTSQKTSLGKAKKFLFNDSETQCAVGGKITIVDHLQIDGAGSFAEIFGSIPLCSVNEDLPISDEQINLKASASEIAAFAPEIGTISLASARTSSKAIFVRYLTSAGLISQADTPAPGPADVFAIGVVIVGTLHTGYNAVSNYLSKSDESGAKPMPSTSSIETKNLKDECMEPLVACLENPWQPPWNEADYGPKKDCSSCYFECVNAGGIWPDYKCPL